MQRFVNVNHMQYLPRSYRGTLPNGTSFRLPWDSSTVLWSSYYASLVRFLTDNGVTAIPSEADVQNFMCQSAPQGCTGDPVVQYQPEAQPATHAPCSTCGKRF